MRSVCSILATSALALTLAGGAAIAQDHHDDQDHHDQSHYVKHDDWRKGHHMRHEDWDRGQRVDDWRTHHLHRPPQGYEWRWVDGQYVCANNDGVIFQVTIGH
ncbi:MAG: RcnB family protein [Terracidiphilus sp.]